MNVSAPFRNEMLKMWKRPAAWVTLGLFTFITLADLGREFFEARKDPTDPFALPEAWVQVLGEEVMIGLIFGSVLLILLIAAEFSWRTARQNVIDGLSKTQWFTAKALLVPFVAALFLAERTLVGGALAWAGSQNAAAGSGPLMGLAQWSALGGFFVAGLGYGSLALAAATAIRSSGPAMAVWFAWFAFGERLIAGTLGWLFEGLKPALRFLPVATFSKLTDYVQYDPVAYRRAVEWASEHESGAPELYDPGVYLLVSALWILVLVAASYGWFRRHDL